MKRVYNKLVRDNIINIIKANGEMPIYRILENDEYWECLLKKDAEELLEVKDAQSKEERKKWRQTHEYKIFSKTGNYDSLKDKNQKKKILK